MIFLLLRKYWREASILGLLGALAWCIQDNRRLEAVAAARPEEKEILGFDEHWAIRAGKSSTTKKKTTKPDGTVIETETVKQDPFEAQRDTLARLERMSKPVLIHERRRFIGAVIGRHALQADAFRAVEAIKGGFTTTRWIIGAEVRVVPGQLGGGVEVSYRF